MAGSDFFEIYNGFYYIHQSFSTLVSVAFLTYILLLFIFRHKTVRADRSFRTVIICNEGKAVTLTALHDTGNSLREPGSNANIIITDYATVREILSESITEIMDPAPPENYPLLIDRLTKSGKFRLVPYRTIDAGFSLMLTYRPRCILIDGKPLSGAIIGFSRQRISGDGIYSAII